MNNKKQKTELADILLRHKEDFLKNHKLCPEQIKAYQAIVDCRTSVLGGHVDKCNKCGHIRCSYNSCRNRHCPKCQFIKQVQWIDKLKANIPPTRCFHMVFTIPRCLHKIFYINQCIAYGLLFKAAAEALKTCSADPKFLGAQIGAVAVLHTWGQALTYHPHIHMVVPGGGLSDDCMEWISSSKKFFLPVKVLSALFRGILCRYIEQSVEKNEIILPDDVPNFEHLKKLAYENKWVVYSKKPFAGPEHVIEYLGKYTHRVAISNQRIIAENEDGMVNFWYKNYRKGGQNRRIALNANEFIMRFLRHVLPSGFYKIRYFGFMAQCNAKTKLEKCFSILESFSFIPQFEGLPAIDVWRAVTAKDPIICPICSKGKMIPVSVWTENKESPG